MSFCIGWSSADTDGGAGSGITYGGAVVTGHNNEVLYISPTGTLTSDSLFIRNVTTGEFSVGGALTADPLAISAVGVGTVESLDGAYLHHDDPTAGFQALWLAGDLTPFGFLSTGSIGGVVGSSGFAGDSSYILSGALGGTDYFTNINTINGNLEAIIGASIGSAKIQFSDITTNVVTAVRAEIDILEVEYQDTVTGERSALQTEAGHVVMMYTPDGVTTNSFKINSTGASFEVDGVIQYIFPLADGTVGQAMVTDGAGILSFENVRPYKVYTALLTQTGTDAPVATVLENTLGGAVVWTRTGIGTYNGTLANAFTADKTWVLIGNGIAGGGDSPLQQVSATSIVNIITQQFDGASFQNFDDVLSGSPIEIRVYY